MILCCLVDCLPALPSLLCSRFPALGGNVVLGFINGEIFWQRGREASFCCTGRPTHISVATALGWSGKQSVP
jgi:hypothetical protein